MNEPTTTKQQFIQAYSGLWNTYHIDANGYNIMNGEQDVLWCKEGKVIIDRKLSDAEIVALYELLERNQNTDEYLRTVTPEQLEADMQAVQS
jgi:hypothetical protein